MMLQESSVAVSDVSYLDVHGTSSDEKAIDLNCSKHGCINIVLDHINITSSVPGTNAYAACNNANGTAAFAVPSVPCL